MTRAVVVDIEGTTSSTASVHVDLYDYARPRLGPWIDAHADDDEVAAAVAATKADAGLSLGRHNHRCRRRPALLDGRRRQGHPAEDPAGTDLGGRLCGGRAGRSRLR